MNAMSTIPTPSPIMRSPWHSPVPYLFGGLAVMLGLIAFALLILACSYWRLNRSLEDENNTENLDLEAGSDQKPKAIQFEEKVLVIMAGHKTPTFLATPVSSNTTSCKSSCSGDEVSVKVDCESDSRKVEGSFENMERQETLS